MMTSQSLTDRKPLDTNQELHRKMAEISHVFFDVDGTLIDDNASKGSVWGRIHALAGIDQTTRDRRLAQHKTGEITYDEWMSIDISDWQRAGITRSQIMEIMGTMHLAKGAKETVEALHFSGYKLGIISSSLDVGILSLLDETLFDELSINRLVFNALGRLSSWDTSACRLSEKGARLEQIAQTLGISPKKIAFVGNDFNDVSATAVAGVTFAFNCCDAELLQKATWVERSDDMRNLLDHFPLVPARRNTE